MHNKVPQTTPEVKHIMIIKDILFQYINEAYGISPEFLFEGDFTTAVFRHSGTKKWFAIFMNIPYTKLGIDKAGNVDIVNVKVPSYLNIGVPGYFPAWHMNKQLWTSILLDGTVPEEELRSMLDMSFDATEKKKRK